MNTEEMLKAIDAQIARLEQARQLIAGNATAEAAAPRQGRSKGSTNNTAAVPARGAKRTIGAEGRARIAAAQELRWAKQKHAARRDKAVTKHPTSATAKKAAERPGSTKETVADERSSDD